MRSLIYMESFFCEGDGYEAKPPFFLFLVHCRLKDFFLKKNVLQIVEKIDSKGMHE